MNTNNELGWKPDIPESYEDGEPAAYEAGFSDGYFYNKNHGIGGIVWYSIAEGNLPPEDTTDHHPNFSIKVLCYSPDEHSNNGIIREGRWHMKRGGWLVYDGGIKPTHWAYINYPEPENSGKEQFS